MNTPIFDFAKEYASSNSVRMHMPGHKGVDTKLGIEHMDITEFDGADNLWKPEGIIKESEANASRLFGAHTFYSTEGSSLSIRAMMFMVKKWAVMHDRTPFILAGRNAHKSFINAAAILDLKIDWLMPKDSDSFQSCSISGEDIDRYFEECERANQERPIAVYITTPDYLGNMLDVKSIANACHKNGAFLIVDNAHGAYLKFLQKSEHPIDLGADMCADSAHKTLPALTGAGYLHVSLRADNFFVENAKSSMELFATTSPSYLILESLDLTNAYLEGFSDKLRMLTVRVSELKDYLIERGYTLKGTELIKITIDAGEYGYTGDKLAEILARQDIYVEYHDEDYLVMMFTTSTSEADFARLTRAFTGIAKGEKIKKEGARLCKPMQRFTPAKALLLPTIEVAKEAAIGEVLGETAVSCPPCVPVYMMGEVIEDTSLLPDRVKVLKRI